MAQTKVGWRAYVNPISSLLTSIYGVWNGELQVSTLDTGLYAAYNAESNVNDSSGNGRNGTPYNVSYTTGKLGSNAFSFAGNVNSYIAFPNNSRNFTGDFSISAWLYFPTSGIGSGLQSDYCHILDNRTAVVWTSDLAGWSFYTYDNTIYITTYNGGQTSLSLGTGTDAPGLSQSGWRHIVFTRTGTTYKLWLDGGQHTATSTTMLTPKYAGTNVPKIGKAGDSTMGGWYSFGSSKIKIDALNIWERALTADEISTLYYNNNGLTNPYGTITYGSAKDSLNNYNGSAVGGLTYTTGKIGNAFTFNGVNSWVDFNTNAMNLGDTFSISYWGYFTNDSASVAQTPLCNYYEVGGKFGFMITSSGGIHAITRYNSATSISSLSTPYVPINQWVHFTFTRKANSTKIYVNGSLVASDTSSVVTSYSVNCKPRIGCREINNVWMVSNGTKIDSLTTWTKELNQTEVTELYNSANGKQYPF